MPTAKPCTILLIDDSAEDRVAYCRYLQRSSARIYQVLEASSAAMGLDLYQRLLPDAILLDYSLPDMDGLAFLAVLQQTGTRVPVLMLTGQGDETIATQAIKSGAQDYLVKGHLTANGLCKALEQAIEQWQLQQRLQQQQQQQQIVSAIALQIRQSLKLQTILDTSVAAIQQALSVDRVVVYQFAPDMSGRIVAEAVLPEWLASLHSQIEDTCFRDNLGGDYRLGRMRAIDNIDEAGLTDCHIKLLERFQVKANLVVPLLITAPHSDSAEPPHDAALPQLWGLLVAHQCAAPRQWQAFEIELLHEVAVQMAIAIQQATAYQQVQAELAERQRLEASLRQSEQRYRSLVTATTQAVWTADPEGKTTDDLPGWRILTGQTETEVQGWGWMEAIHPDDQPKTVEAWRIATTTKQMYEVEHRVRMADGGYKFFMGRAVPVIDETGNLREWIGAHTDISERKQAEIALQQLNQELERRVQERTAKLRVSEARLREAQRIARLGHWEYDLQTQSMTWSDELFRLFGLAPTPVAPSYEAALALFVPASRVQLNQAVQAVARDGTPWMLELQGTHTDGRRLWFVARGEAVSDTTGAVVKLLGTVQDISDRKQAEQQLELQSIVTRNMAEGVCLVRARDGVIVYTNPKFERLFGYAAGTLEGQHVSVVNYKDATTDPIAVSQSIMSTILQQGEATYEVQNVKQDDTPFWCQATTSTFEHPEYGTVLVAVQQDITERKQAEALIRAALKEKEVLLQEIHHRVKNNLQIVYSLLRLQRRRLKDPQAAAVLLESQNRIETIALVHEKLYRAGDLAHINASEYIPNLVVNLVSTYGLDAHRVQLELAIEPLPLSMDCAVPCGLMINELVSNAFKYAFPDQRPGQLTVSLCADTTTADTTTADTTTAHYVTLTVADNGVGLPAHVSVGDATTLGLQLVSDFVDQLKGTLQLDMTNGTSIQIRFPQSP